MCLGSVVQSHATSDAGGGAAQRLGDTAETIVARAREMVLITTVIQSLAHKATCKGHAPGSNTGVPEEVLDSDSATRLLVLRGDAWMGKTCLLTKASHVAASCGVDWVLTGGDSREAGACLLAVKNLLSELLKTYTASQDLWHTQLGPAAKTWMRWLRTVNPEVCLLLGCGTLGLPKRGRRV